MPPKKPDKDKGGKKPKEEPDPNALTEVDKTFYELQIADINRKLARLRTLVAELERKNEELTTANEQLEQDRADIVAFLNRTLAEKEADLKELQEGMKALLAAKGAEKAMYEAKIKKLEEEYKSMHEQLTSEIKLLQGKLNSLEEFRLQRDDLMKKYLEQEAAMAEQEIRHKRELYEIERKFIIGKDKLKKEMEARLLQLSTDFQDATEVRIASTTHRVIRENITINNELTLLLETLQRLQTENEALKESTKKYRMQMELFDTEKKKALRKSKVQHALLERLSVKNDYMRYRMNDITRREIEMQRHNVDEDSHERDVCALRMQIKLLEQNLHACRCECLQNKNDSDYFQKESARLWRVLCRAARTINTALKVRSGVEMEEGEAVSSRDDLLNELFNLLSTVEETKLAKPSFTSLESISTAIYQRGDAGLIPKTQHLRIGYPIFKLAETQVGESMEELIAMYEEGEVKPEETDSEAALRMISDPDLLRSLLKERQREKDALGQEGPALEKEKIESETLFEGVQEESEVEPEPYDLLYNAQSEDELAKAFSAIPGEAMETLALSVSAVAVSRMDLKKRALSQAAFAEAAAAVASSEHLLTRSASRVKFKEGSQMDLGEAGEKAEEGEKPPEESPKEE